MLCIFNWSLFPYNKMYQLLVFKYMYACVTTTTNMKAFSLLGRVTWCPCPFPVNLQLHSLFQATTDLLYITIYEIYHFHSISGILSLSTILTHVNNHIWLIILTYTLKSASFFFFHLKNAVDQVKHSHITLDSPKTLLSLIILQEIGFRSP